MANKGSCDTFDKVAVLTISENLRVNLCAKTVFTAHKSNMSRFVTTRDNSSLPPLVRCFKLYNGYTAKVRN